MQHLWNLTLSTLSVVLVAIVVSCGGGGGGGSVGVTSTAAPAPVIARVTKAHACYYGMAAADVTPTVDHADCVDAGGWNPDDQIETLRLTQGTGRPLILMSVDVCKSEIAASTVEAVITAWLQTLNALGRLDNQVIDGVRACDEPRISDAEVKARLASVQIAMAKFPATRGKPLAMYWPCGDADFPGLSMVKLPGCDAYDWSFDRIQAVYRERFEPLADADPSVKLIHIVGVSDPWRADPTSAVSAVLADERYWGVEAFGFARLDIYPNGASTNGRLALVKTQFQRITK